MILSMVCAASQNGVIGIDNRLPWRLPGDMQHFRKLTQGHPVIMGRKTFMSIGRPLAKRTNIILTRQENFQAEGCIVVHTLEEALACCRNEAEAFVIGGAEIYRLALPLTDRIHLTIIHEDFVGDSQLFPIDETEWHIVGEERHEADERNPHAYTFFVYERSGLNRSSTSGNLHDQSS